MGELRTAIAREYIFPNEDFDPVLASEALTAALKFLKSEWNFSNDKIASILKISKTKVRNWVDEENIPVGNGGLGADVEALVALLSIQRSLHAMFSSPAKQLEWLNTPHPGFGEAPIVLIAKSYEDLFSVRQYLDYVRSRGA